MTTPPTGTIDKLRAALAAFDALEPAEMFPPLDSREAAANTLASYVRDLLAEVDGALRVGR